MRRFRWGLHARRWPSWWPGWRRGYGRSRTARAWCAYLAAMSRFHQYAAGNILLVLAQKPDATRLAGFHTWLRLGRHVKRGEHGIRILAPVTARRQAESEDDDEPDARTVLRWRVVTVFEYSQTEGTDLPPHPCQTLTTDSERGRWLFARLLQVARAEGIELRADIRGLGTAHGAYVPGTRVIALAPGLSDDQRAKTLAHDPLTARNTSLTAAACPEGIAPSVREPRRPSGRVGRGRLMPCRRVWV